MTIAHSDPLKVILVSTLLGAMILELLLISSIFYGNGAALLRSSVGMLAILYLIIAIITYLRQHLVGAAWMITAFYFTIGIATAFIWGINAPVAILILSFSLLLSAMILPIRYIFINTTILVTMLLINQILVSITVLRPMTSGLSSLSTFADLFIYTIIFAMFAVLTWLFASRITAAFDQLSLSNQIIERQNKRIAKELQLEKKRLRLSEIAKTSQLAAFSDIGQYTSLLMHDLSNELAILKMRDETHSTSDFKETSKIIDEIERLIERSRRALSHKSETKSIKALLNEIAENFHYYSDISKVSINVESQDTDEKVSNAHLLYQVLSIIVKNAVDAYASQPVGDKREIRISSKTVKGRLTIHIQDWAGGIPGYKDNRVFNGLTSTKKNGHGLGLHLCRIIVIEQLNGSISYEKLGTSSKFTVMLSAR